MKPSALKSGDTIGVIAPASPMTEQKRADALATLQGFGFRIKVGASVYEQNGYLSGTDELRAHDLNQMFADPEVQAIICLRGGYGTLRILDRIDYDLIRQNPKILVGFSDITALHLAINKRTGLVTFHGPMAGELSHLTKEKEVAWSVLFRHLTDPAPLGSYPDAEQMFRYSLHPGTATGPLIGGNLSLLVSTLGTPYELDTAGKILFIEEIGEEPYRIDRMLTQLRLAGKLEQAVGIVFTDFHDCEPDNPERSLTLHEVLAGIVGPLGIPAYWGLKVGHTEPNLTLPLGVRAKIQADDGVLALLEGGVR